ncbi:MAG: CAP domain-containing protein [Butyrivibrio sp.]|nr:CAP domain-containing protein [Butyrivibrio sp.]
MKKTIVSLVTLLLIGLLLCPVAANASDSKADDVLAEINEYRESYGLGALTMDQGLTDVASVRAEECSQRFSHIRPNGEEWYTVSSLTNGENLAHAKNNNQQKPENVVLAWMLSPGHSANVLRKSYSTAGIYYYQSDSGEIYIACEFR